MFKYETHLHTFPVSKCAAATVEESLAFYKALGYDGVFITNHFIDGNIGVDKKRPYREKIAFYFSDYENGLVIGKKLGIKVFLGVETTYKGTDFLVYGLDKNWFLAHPEIEEMKKSEELDLFMENGALVIQAHPFRQADYINHIRLFPDHVHGVEILNASRTAAENEMARLYATHYRLLPFAGSDNHKAGLQKTLAGLSAETPLTDEADFVKRVKTGEMRIFSDEITA